jgi:hypothetical protein
MTKYGMDGAGNIRRKNEQVGQITLVLNTSGLGSVSTPFSSRFRNTPAVVVQMHTCLSTYAGLTVTSYNTRFFELKALLVGNISRTCTASYIAIDDGPFP